MKANYTHAAALTLACLLWSFAAAMLQAQESGKIPSLSWKLKSGCMVDSTGDRISLAAYHSGGWIDALVPGTVLGSQVAAGLFADPFFGMNLRKVPGTDYPITKIFGYLPMSADSPYRCPWWYRSEFTLPSTSRRRTRLHFDGINYRANIWFNGKQIATSDAVAGAFRSYDFDVSQLAVSGERNVLAVEVLAQTENDLGIDFLDWNAAPADKSMGLWRGVSIVSSGDVAVSNPAVLTRFVSEDLTEAELQVVADVANLAKYPVHVRVSAVMGANHMEQFVDLAAQESRVIHFEASKFAGLQVKNPDVWWPYQYGDSHLQHVSVSAAIDGRESDAKGAAFGIREITASRNQDGFLQFQVNHRNILIRGGGWAPDLFYREPRERLRQELAYVKDMHLNAIRMEGKLGSEDLFELADEMGILVMAGWQCCDAWQKWDKWTQTDHAIANASTYSQISRLRSHACMLAWLNGSDEVPASDVERDFLAVLKERDWANPVLSTAADRVSAITGRSGVKMTGPYDYVPPEYWYLDKNNLGGAFGFNTETGPGPAVPTVASIKRTLPRKSWWPIDEQWTYHAGLGKFAQYSNFTNAMNATYGVARTLEDYSLKAQLMAYDGERAMFEAYGGNKYRSTGVIQWMLNNAWPSFIWHLYDYYLVPGGGYFGAKKANEPLHIQYQYDDRSISVVNSTLKSYKGLRAAAKSMTPQGKELFSQDVTLDLEGDGVAHLFAVPAAKSTSFLELRLHDAQGQPLSENLYWVPAQLAKMDWNKSTYVNTPAISYADMRDLEKLPKVGVHAHVLRSPTLDGAMRVLVRNDGGTIAFFLHLQAVSAESDEDVAPVFWEDNYVSLLPGQTRVLRVHGLGRGKVKFNIEGWNVLPQTIYP